VRCRSPAPAGHDRCLALGALLAGTDACRSALGEDAAPVQAAGRLRWPGPARAADGYLFRAGAAWGGQVPALPPCGMQARRGGRPQGAGDSSGGHQRRDSPTGRIRPTSLPSGSATIACRAPQNAPEGGCRPAYPADVRSAERSPAASRAGSANPMDDTNGRRIAAPARLPQPGRLGRVQLQAKATRHSQLHMRTGRVGTAGRGHPQSAIKVEAARPVRAAQGVRRRNARPRGRAERPVHLQPALPPPPYICPGADPTATAA
jgi:hypothetical protein